jgi:uncharacterized protein YyaL (SSP411 family)
MANALIQEKSPYLLQHANNPVDWLPWGDEAFKKSRSEDKPIFLSIGYSTCHWCHVMERESFENAATAQLLNEHFVPIKVDREERPDVDRIYMLFVQATTGSGGWPMSVWLTPDLKPFFGGTYFPPDARYGRAGFPDVLKHIAQAWRENRDQLSGSSERIVSQLERYVSSTDGQGELEWSLFHSCFQPLRRSFDSQYGGFGSAPKFPRPVTFNYLLREYAASKNDEALEMTAQTLKAMASGGMNDQLGGGFHRYSVDRHWLVPHFEKMLYDQAQLAISFVETFQITRDPAFEQIARAIFTYVLRDLRHPEGGFFSAEDADSPDPENPSHKAEGAFYVWRQSEIEGLLGEALSSWFCHYYGVQRNGNVRDDPHEEFAGKNILHLSAKENQSPSASTIQATELSKQLANAKQVLLAARSRRPRPHLDDKILTSWNGLMISAFAKGAQVLKSDEYLTAATEAANFLLTRMYDSDSGRLLRRFREGEAAIDGFLDDYAFFAQALLDLYEASFNAYYLTVAVRLARESFRRFEDSEHGGFFSTTGDDKHLLLRIKDDYDGAEPSGNSVAADVLLRLARLTGDDEFRSRAERSIRSFVPKLKEQSMQAPQMFVALARALSPPVQHVIRCREINDQVRALADEHAKNFDPNAAFAVIPDESVGEIRDVAPFLASLERKGEITIYQCANFVCQLPVVIEAAASAR